MGLLTAMPPSSCRISLRAQMQLATTCGSRSRSMSYSLFTTSASTKASGRASLKAGFAGKPVQAASVSLSSRRAERLVVRAEEAKAPAKAEKKEEAPWSPPKLNPNTPSPIFGGSTGGLLRKAQVSTGIFFLLAATRSVERGSEPRMTRGAVVDRGRKPPTRRARR